MNDTPRTDKMTLNASLFQYNSETPAPLDIVAGEFARELERELNAAHNRIKLLEETGDSMVAVMQDDWEGFTKWINTTNSATHKWKQAKENK